MSHVGLDELDVPAIPMHRNIKIKVIGVGGGGGSAINNMVNSAIEGVEYIAINTDTQALDRSQAQIRITLGETGFGAGNVPERAKEAAETASDQIREVLRGTDILFLAAGLGGGTGTGASPVIARIAKELGVLTVAVVTKPFKWEAKRRAKNAEQGLSELAKNVDSYVVILSDNVVDVDEVDLTEDEAYEMVNNVLRDAVGGTAHVILGYGNINVDFEDVKTIIRDTGRAIVGLGRASGEDRAKVAVERALSCPLLEGQELVGTKGTLVVTSAKKGSLKLREKRQIVEYVCDKKGVNSYEDAHVISGSYQDDSMGEDEISVTVLVTGLEMSSDQKAVLSQASVNANLQSSSQSISMVSGHIHQRTGTDNVGLVKEAEVGFSAPTVPGALSPSDYGSLDRPAVLKNQRVSSATSGISSAEDIKTPTFLRQQND